MMQHNPRALLLEQIHFCSLACAARLAAAGPTNSTQALHYALLCNPVHLHRRLQPAKHGIHAHVPKAHKHFQPAGHHTFSSCRQQPWLSTSKGTEETTPFGATLLMQAMNLAECKEKKRKDYTFWHQLNAAGGTLAECKWCDCRLASAVSTRMPSSPDRPALHSPSWPT